MYVQPVAGAVFAVASVVRRLALVDGVTRQQQAVNGEEPLAGVHGERARLPLVAADGKRVRVDRPTLEAVWLADDGQGGRVDGRHVGDRYVCNRAGDNRG